MKQGSTNPQVLKYVKKLTPQERIRIAFNLWQFARDLQEKNLDKKYLESWAKKQKTEKLLKGLLKIDLEQYY